jgi:hypothetical protein
MAIEPVKLAIIATTSRPTANAIKEDVPGREAGTVKSTMIAGTANAPNAPTIGAYPAAPFLTS